MTHWTDEENALFKRLWGEGVPIVKMASHFPGRTLLALKLRGPAMGLPQRSKPRHWENEEITYLCENAGVLQVREMSKHLGRTPVAVSMKLKEFRLVKEHKPIRRFTPEEDALLKKGYIDNQMAVEDIANMLGRTVGVLRQHIMKLGLHRDNRRQRLINRFGERAKDLTHTPAEIRAAFEAERKAEWEAIKQRNMNVRKEAVLVMRLALQQGMPRRAAFQQALLEGATLQDIGEDQGITRERVRQVAHHVIAKYKRKDPSERKPRVYVPEEAACKNCGKPFMKSYYNNKYCDDCSGTVRARQYQGYQTQLKLERLKWKLSKLSPEELNYVIGRTTEVKAGVPAEGGGQQQADAGGHHHHQGHEGSNPPDDQNGGGPPEGPATGGGPGDGA